MSTSETKKAAYRWVAELILNEASDVFTPGDAPFWAEVERIRDALAQAGAIPVAQTEGES